MACCVLNKMGGGWTPFLVGVLALTAWRWRGRRGGPGRQRGQAETRKWTSAFTNCGRTPAAPGKRPEALHARFRDHTLKIFAKHGMKVEGFWKPSLPRRRRRRKADLPPLFPQQGGGRQELAGVPRRRGRLEKGQGRVGEGRAAVEQAAGVDLHGFDRLRPDEVTIPRFLPTKTQRTQKKKKAISLCVLCVFVANLFQFRSMTSLDDHF